MLTKLFNIRLSIVGAVLVLVSGCTAYDYGYGASPSGMTAQSSQASSRQNNQVKRELARMRADIRQVAEAQRRQAGRIEEINDRLAALRTAVNEARRQAASDGDRDAISSLKRRLDRLQRDLAAEEKARKAADKEVVSSVSSEVSSMIQTNQDSGSSGANLQARGKYTVKQGDTLSAIASAFGVSVKDLKAINDLQSDMIREGQQLLIPQD